MNEVSEQRSSLCCGLVAEVAETGSEVCLKVTGSSMLPAVWPGDVLTVRRCQIVALQPGQIVLSRRNGQLVAHRLTSICGDDLLITRGDSMPQNDPAMSASEVVGQVVGLSRNGRPVKLRQSFWQRASAFILQRSDFCMRMTLRLGLRLRRLRERQISWVL